MRICSLLPSATEILFALGLGDDVLGVSHECDYPPEARSRTVLTRCAFDSAGLTQAEIDAEVRRVAREERSLYEIDDERLREAAPDLIVTQDLCDVCAITPKEVERAVAGLPKRPRIVSLNPSTLDDVFADILKVADAATVDGHGVVEALCKRVDRISRSAPQNLVTVGCIEWLDPLWRTGHWVPEMVRLAGGRELFAQIGRPSRTLSWDELQQGNPDVIIMMPCGLDLAKTREEFLRVREKFPWEKLKALQTAHLYGVDANSYFSRPGPRLAGGIELLAELLHPEYFDKIAPNHSCMRLTLSV